MRGTCFRSRPDSPSLQFLVTTMPSGDQRLKTRRGNPAGFDQVADDAAKIIEPSNRSTVTTPSASSPLE